MTTQAAERFIVPKKPRRKFRRLRFELLAPFIGRQQIFVGLRRWLDRLWHFEPMRHLVQCHADGPTQAVVIVYSRGIAHKRIDYDARPPTLPAAFCFEL